MIKKQDTIYLILLSLISLFYLSGIKDVPFHPDESTQIFMSEDFTAIFTSFSSLFWEKENEGEIRQYYHEMDAPLTRYLIGFGRWIGRQTKLEEDWDWSKTWEENQQSGALPGNKLLLISRLSVAAYFPISLFLIFFSAKKDHNAFLGFLTALLFGINSLVWLHTRRAMAESLLLFNIILFIYLSYTLKKREVLFALPAALAFNAKQTGIILLFLGFFEIFRRKKKEPLPSILLSFGKYGLVFCLITVILNPFLWKHPIQAAQAALISRSEFTINQQKTYQQAAPALVLNTSGKKFFSYLYQVFLAEPIPSESGNYLSAQEQSFQDYLTNPLNLISNNIVFKGLFLLSFLGGFFLSAFDLLKNKLSGPILTVWTGSLLFTLFLVFFLPLSFQRYYLPVLPFYSFHVSYLLHKLFNKSQKKLSLPKK